MTGLRAELSVSAVESCPVAAASREATDTLRDVTWTTDDTDGTVERFDAAAGESLSPTADAESDDAGSATDATTPDSVAGDAAAETVADDAAAETTFETVFDDGQTETVEFGRDWDDCVCERMEAVGCPIDDVRAADGRLLIQFRVRSNERLREVIDAAREVAGDVRLEYVVGAGEERSDAVVVDRGRLTERQREVLETAYASGYFAHPREANAETVAAELGVSPSTFREHLATAQAKLFGAVLGEETADLA
ncbi:helix-turn-helix domain-containing protein [Halobaculum sp. MBLA0147]|uniref:helix-turn-helix domain-containing protein n=1 Tax=Halobaculum sp. MBLA0147 TaxID=3079934 RepID=UPI00352614F0